jgi:hypothetical protein
MLLLQICSPPLTLLQIRSPLLLPLLLLQIHPPLLLLLLLL